MAKIVNPSGRPIRLPTGHVVAAASIFETTNDVLRCADNQPMLGGLAKSGQITLEFDPEIDPDGITTPLVVIEPLPEALAQQNVDAQIAAAAAETAAGEKALAEMLTAEAAPRKK